MRLITFAYCCLVTSTVVLSACAENEVVGDRDSRSSYEAFEEALIEVYSRKPKESSKAYKLLKRGAVESWLATIHGYPNNAEVCEKLIAPYNADPKASVLTGIYYCEPIVHAPLNSVQ